MYEKLEGKNADEFSTRLSCRKIKYQMAETPNKLDTPSPPPPHLKVDVKERVSYYFQVGMWLSPSIREESDF